MYLGTINRSDASYAEVESHGIVLQGMRLGDIVIQSGNMGGYGGVMGVGTRNETLYTSVHLAVILESSCAWLLGSDICPCTFAGSC